MRSNYNFTAVDKYWTSFELNRKGLRIVSLWNKFSQKQFRGKVINKVALWSRKCRVTTQITSV